MTFLVVCGKNAPAFTVASLAMIMQGIPATLPQSSCSRERCNPSSKVRRRFTETALQLVRAVTNYQRGGFLFLIRALPPLAANLQTADRNLHKTDKAGRVLRAGSASACTSRATAPDSFAHKVQLNSSMPVRFADESCQPCARSLDERSIDNAHPVEVRNARE